MFTVTTVPIKYNPMIMPEHTYCRYQQFCLLSTMILSRAKYLFEVSARGEHSSPSATTLTDADSTAIARGGAAVCADSCFKSIRLEYSVG